MNKKNLEKAANKSVTKNRRNMRWPVYEQYFVCHEDKQGPYGLERTPHLGAPGPKLGSREVDFRVSRYYAPLQHPEILFKLAEIGDLLNAPDKRKKQTTPLAEMQAFADKYGLLGVSDPTGRDESLLEFTVAASRVARTLRLFEAASANDGDGDEAKLRALYRDTLAHRLPDVEPDDVEAYRRQIERTRRDDLRERALDEVSETVSEALRTRTFHAQYRLRNKRGRTVGFDEGHGFHNLLGAVYLLLDYLMRDPNARRCEVCNEFIDPNKYSNSAYCSAACKQAEYRKRKKEKAR